MNDQVETVGKGPAIASAEAMSQSDHEAIEVIRDQIGYVAMYASSARFGIDALEQCIAPWNAHTVGHISRVASEKIRRRLELSAMTQDFDAELAYKYGVKFLHTAVLNELVGKPAEPGIKFMPEDRRDELAFVMALSALNHFIVMFEVHMAFKNDQTDASNESVIARHRAQLASSRMVAGRPE